MYELFIYAGAKVYIVGDILSHSGWMSHPQNSCRFSSISASIIMYCTKECESCVLQVIIEGQKKESL